MKRWIDRKVFWVSFVISSAATYTLIWLLQFLLK